MSIGAEIPDFPAPYESGPQKLAQEPSSTNATKQAPREELKPSKVRRQIKRGLKIAASGKVDRDTRITYTVDPHVGIETLGVEVDKKPNTDRRGRQIDGKHELTVFQVSQRPGNVIEPAKIETTFYDGRVSAHHQIGRQDNTLTEGRAVISSLRRRRGRRA
ncbi:MAG TPA: hypothetical protein VNA13_00855 [Xanthomonadales bacterium]|nr:hypothetical protein [Xanthomonadales bacterium]